MKKIIFLSLILYSCSVFETQEPSLIQPKLIKQTELPPLKTSVFFKTFEFYCEMLVNTNGDVEKVKLLNSFGDAEWDSSAQIALMQWKYSPAIYDGHPIKLNIRRKIKVVFVEPIIIPLGEIELPDFQTADSVYKFLLMGNDFNFLASQYSISASKNKNGLLGQVNIRHYSKEISSILNELKEGEFTKPLAYGEHYIIFKRMKLNN